jgi:hypothetical protein
MPWTEAGPAKCVRWTVPDYVVRGWPRTASLDLANLPISRVGSRYPYQRLFEAACPGPVDRPHRGRLYLLSFWVQNYWSRWAHSRRGFVDLRWNGKVRCKPDETWDTTVAMGLEDAICRKIDLLPLGELFRKIRSAPVLGFFLLWLLAGLGAPAVAWEDRPPTPQYQNIKIYRGGEAPFHSVPKPSPSETIKLLNLYRRKGDVVARNTIVAGYLGDAKRIARRFQTDEVEDLEQDAAEALLEAVEKYAVEHEAAFSTFMYEVVEKRCIDSLRDARGIGATSRPRRSQRKTRLLWDLMRAIL